MYDHNLFHVCKSCDYTSGPHVKWAVSMVFTNGWVLDIGYRISINIQAPQDQLEACGVINTGIPFYASAIIWLSLRHTKKTHTGTS